MWGSGFSAGNDDEEQTVLTIAQLIQFHAKKRKRPDTSRSLHEVNVPVPTYIALKVHGETRSKDIVDTLHKMGISISYDHLKKITAGLANRVCSLYHSEGVVCPPSLQSEIFTTAAIDNIDHNPSSTTAEGSFHGTAISIMQHPTEENPGISRMSVVPQDDTRPSKKLMSLPAEYTQVSHFFLNFKPHSMTPAVY